MTGRFNRTLHNMLGTLENSEKQNWKKYILSLIHAYNDCTRYESTGYSPLELMFGRKPRLPIDVAFGLENSKENKNYNEYILDIMNRMAKNARHSTKSS